MTGMSWTWGTWDEDTSHGCKLPTQDLAEAPKDWLCESCGRAWSKLWVLREGLIPID